MGLNPDGNLLVDDDEQSLKQQEEADRKWYAIHASSPKTGEISGQSAVGCTQLLDDTEHENKHIK